MNSDRALRQRAWYYSRIYADTKSNDNVYVVNVSYHKSTDGGKTFSSYHAPHGDHHDLWIAPEDPRRMIIGDDGGAQITYDGGQTWSTYHNQPTAQFYRVTTDNAFPYRIYAAQQDNSTVRIAHRSRGSSITEDDWEPTAGGESAHLAVDPTNPDIVYGGSYDGFLTRVDHKLHTFRAVNVWPDNPMGHGAEGMKYRFCKTCNPRPGDLIVGYINKSARNITIHRLDCRELQHLDPGRIILASWGGERETKEVKVIVEVEDRPGVLKDIATLAASKNINIKGISFHPRSKGRSIGIIVFETPDLTSAQLFLSEIQGMESVAEVRDSSIN